MAEGLQRLVRIARYPQGLPEPADFRLDQAPVPVAAPGQLLLRNRLLSIEPYLRPLLAGRYVVPRPPLGAPVPGTTLAEVVAGDDPRFPPGTLVVAEGSWSEYLLAAPEGLRPVPADVSPSSALGALGIPGLTAWAGLRHIGQPKAGETVLVSSAAGTVGSVAGQLAKLAGCRVVGIAGGPEKCRLATGTFGFDDCIDYRAGDLGEALRRACPDGVDVYFDNVGSEVLAAALRCLRLHARVVLCGLISQYNEAVPPPGPNLGPVVGARARMQGLVVYDHLGEYAQFVAEVAPLVRDGRLRQHEQAYEGIAAAPEAFAALMRGQCMGKVLVRLD